MNLQGHRLDNIPLAVDVIIGTLLALSLGDALIKLTSRNFVIWQIFVNRPLIAIPVLLLVLAEVVPANLRMPSESAWIFLRSLVLVVVSIGARDPLPVHTIEPRNDLRPT